MLQMYKEKCEGENIIDACYLPWNEGEVCSKFQNYCLAVIFTENKETFRLIQCYDLVRICLSSRLFCGYNRKNLVKNKDCLIVYEQKSMSLSSNKIKLIQCKNSYDHSNGSFFESMTMSFCLQCRRGLCFTS